MRAKLLTLFAGVSVGAIVAAVLGLLIFGAEFRSFRARAKADAAPVVAPPTKLEAGSDDKLLLDRDVQAIEPGKRGRQKIAEKYDRPDLTAEAVAETIAAGAIPAEVLGERTIPCPGGDAEGLLTLEPSGRVEITVKPKPEKFWDWRSSYEAGAVYGRSLAGEVRGRGWVAAEPFGAGRFRLRGEAGVDVHGGISDGYVMAGFVWRSK